jgi:hypothetical protein
MKTMHKIALAVLGVIFLVLGVMLLLGVIRGDDTTYDTDNQDGGAGIGQISQVR